MTAGTGIAPSVTARPVVPPTTCGKSEMISRSMPPVPAPDLDEMRVLKQELREVIADPSVLPDGTLLTAASEDGADEAFPARLWREPYGGEPVWARLAAGWCSERRLSGASLPFQRHAGLVDTTGGSLKNPASTASGSPYRPAALPWGPHRPYEG